MSASIASDSSVLLRHLFDPAARSLPLGLVAALALFATRAKSAPARLAVWTAVLYASLAMPFLPLLVPAIGVPLPSRLLTLVTRSSAASASAPASSAAVASSPATAAPAPTIVKRSPTELAAAAMFFGESARSRSHAARRATPPIAPRLH